MYLHLKDPFGSSAEHDVAKIPYRVDICYDGDDDDDDDDDGNLNLCV